MKRLGPIVVWTTLTLCAQSVGNETFEIASVKPNRTIGAAKSLQINRDGGVTFQAVTVMDVIQLSYGVEPFQVKSTIGWVSSARFDIRAKGDDALDSVPEETSSVVRNNFLNRVHTRLRNLLAERCESVENSV